MFEQDFKNINDVLWKEKGCSTELDYTEQASWILFLKYLDDLERANETKEQLKGKSYQYIGAGMKAKLLAVAALLAGCVLFTPMPALAQKNDGWGGLRVQGISKSLFTALHRRFRVLGCKRCQVQW